MTVKKSKSVQIISVLCLLFATVIWGSSFVTQTDGAKHMQTFTLMAYRSYIASFAMGIIILVRYLLNKKNDKCVFKTKSEKRDNFIKTSRAGILCGASFTLAAALQQMGIYYNTVVLGIDTAGRAGFVTALYIILVPIAAMMFGKKCGASIWIGAVFCLTGMYFLCVSGEGGFSLGDIFLLGCALSFTAQILVIDMICYKYDSLVINFWQFFTAAIISTPISLIFESNTMENLYDALPSMLYLGVIGSAVAYTIQIATQKNLHPAVASLIMSFESVFATIAGVVFLDESMTAVQILSCVAIFIGILIAQFGSYVTYIKYIFKSKKA